jgi:hypothetical protein
MIFDGVHEPLVDELTFAKAQAILAERGEHAKRGTKWSVVELPGIEPGSPDPATGLLRA